MPVSGPAQSPILLVGEAPWFDEIAKGEPFTGASGAMLTRVLQLVSKQRESYRIGNIVSCAIPDMAIDRFPAAVAQCRYLDDAIDALPPKVVVPLGGAALRRILQLPRGKEHSVENFHGTVTRDPTDRFWVVPTYHPSHLQRGATNLMGVSAFDLQRASEVAQQGWAPDPAQLWLDPSVEWFRVWANAYIAAATQDPYAYPLSVDIETPDKGSDEGAMLADAVDRSYQIIRVNLSAGPDEGVTIPFAEGYVQILAEVLAAGGVQYYWFKGFDVPRLVAAGFTPRIDRLYDAMWCWKALQSDLPGSLGFVAPFYSKFGAWKHLVSTQPAQYAAVDALQTRRVGDGLIADLITAGQWEVFERHMHEFHWRVLQPATDIGVPIDRERLTAFTAKLDAEASRLLTEIAEGVPADLCPCTPKEGLTRPPSTFIHPKARTENLDGSEKADPPDPLKQALYLRATIIEKLVLREVLVCRTCGKQEITAKHRCQPSLLPEGVAATPALVKEVVSVKRWFWQEPFNPDSPQQLLAYAMAKHHQPGKSKQTGEPSMDRDTLTRLYHEHDESLYLRVLSYRAVGKVRGTYAIGTEKRLDANDRIHPAFTFKPSTMRLSATNPNIQNVVADKGGSESLAAGFRTCVVAKPIELEGVGGAPAVWDATCLIEADYSGIEAVLLGWCMRDPAYMQLAKLGMHAYLASHLLKRPADLGWPTAELAAYFKTIKNDPAPLTQRAYNQAKRTVHGKGYGLTVYGLLRNNPQLFKSLKEAEHIDKVYQQIAPSVPRFHASVRDTAHRQHYLGGAGTYTYDHTTLKVSGHPFAYKHWFWSVVAYERLTESQRLWRLKRDMPMIDINGIWWGVKLGEDAKRVVALYPQSIARGVLTEGCFQLFTPESPTYIGDVYYGAIPLRAPIHDSLLLEVPTRLRDRVLERCALAMQAPVAALPCPPEWGMGTHLSIDVEAKVGADWAHMEKVALPTYGEGARVVEVASDTPYTPEDDDAEDDVLALESGLRAVG